MTDFTGAGLQRASLTTLITATGNGTFNINPWVSAGVKLIRVQLLAGGTGAGSGRKGAAGTVRCAGGPGAPGAFVDVMIPIADILAAFPTGLVPYNVGPGTAGGAAVTTDDTNGNPGAATVAATNGTWLGAPRGTVGCLANANAGGPGAGGTNASGTAGSVTPGTVPIFVNNSASATGGPGPGANAAMSGQGGGITSGDVPGAGAAGAAPIFSPGVSSTGGVVGGASPTSGTLGALVGPGAAPGGGAASITGNAQAGANALPNSGAGGGSGGASLNGASKDSGKGGDGGSGFLRITGMI